MSDRPDPELEEARRLARPTAPTISGEPEIKPGALVRLKSGGPRMTVNAIHGETRCECMWFDGDDLCRDDFAIAALRVVSETEPA